MGGKSEPQETRSGGGEEKAIGGMFSSADVTVGSGVGTGGGA